MTSKTVELIENKPLELRLLWLAFSLIRWWDVKIGQIVWGSPQIKSANAISNITPVEFFDEIKMSSIFSDEVGTDGETWLTSLLLGYENHLPDPDWLQYVVGLDRKTRIDIANILYRVSQSYNDGRYVIPAWVSAVTTTNLARHVSNRESFTKQEMSLLEKNYDRFKQIGMVDLFWEKRCMFHLSHLSTERTIKQVEAMLNHK